MKHNSIDELIAEGQDSLYAQFIADDSKIVVDADDLPPEEELGGGGKK